jgi:peptide chain release factor 1
MLERLAAIEGRYDEIDGLLSDPELSSDYSRIQNLVKEQASIKNLVALSRDYREVLRQLDDVRAMLRDGSDSELAALAQEELDGLEARKETIDGELANALLPRDPNDQKNVILEIRAGTGGDEAGLFAADLFRMYTRYSQRKGWKTDIVDTSQTGIGGIREVVFQVKGEGAYSRLKHESGTHRVQRVPVTESSGRLHTSASTVAVLPEAEEVDVEVKSDDLQIDIFHSSGHGGQNVQKVATAVRITHTPTGIVAICQDERSQLKNKEKAMAVLRSRLLAREIQRQRDKESANRRSQVGSGDRSERVRTYNFPQNRVTDHRIALTSHNLDEVLDGDLDAFINGLIELEKAQMLEEAVR